MAKWHRIQDLALLSGVQLSNLLIPLILTPYLSRILSKGEFGHYVALLSLSLTISILVEYSFSFSGVRDAVKECSLDQLFSNILAAKLILSVIAISLSIIPFIFLNQLNSDYISYYSSICYGIVLGFSPMWFFQATMNVRSAAFFEIASKFFGLVCIFLFVKSNDDYWKIFFLQSFAFLCSIIANYISIYKKIGFAIPSLGGMEEQIRNGWQIFLNRFISASYTTANIAILQLFFPLAFLGIFSNAERIVNASKSFILPITQIFFPQMVIAFNQNRKTAFKLFSKLFMLALILAVVIFSVVYLSSSFIVNLLFGPSYKESANMIRILALNIFPVAGSAAIAYFWIIPQGHESVFTKITALTAFLNFLLIICIFRFLPDYKIVYLSISVETFAFISLLSYFIFNEWELIKAYTTRRIEK